MVVALVALSTAQGASSGAAWVSVAALLLYVGCYQVSFGPISWLIVGEVRGVCVCVDVGVDFDAKAVLCCAVLCCAVLCCAVLCCAVKVLKTSTTHLKLLSSSPSTRTQQVFPLTVRSQAIAMAAVLNYGSNFGVSLALPSVETAVGLPATYAGFASVAVLALLSIYFTVPETKGKTLEEIEAMWGSGGASSAAVKDDGL